MERPTSFPASGSLAVGTSTMYGLAPASGNQGYTASIAQSWLDRMFIRNIEPELLFARFGKMATIVAGYLTHQFARMDDVATSSVTQLTAGGVGGTATPGTGTSIGITPNPVQLNAGTISVTPDQFAIYTVMADMLVDFSALNLMKKATEVLGRACGRRIDEYTQNVLYTKLTATSGGVYYVDHQTTPTATSLASYNSAQFKGANRANGVMKMSDLARMAAKLYKNHAPKMNIGGSEAYCLIVHPDVMHELITETGLSGFINVFAQTSPAVMRIMKGYVGTVYGIHVLQSANVQTKRSVAGNSNSTLVYPSYAIAEGLYGIFRYNFRVFRTPMTSSDSDPLAQRTKFGIKFVYSAVVLDTKCGFVSYSTARTA